MKTLPAFACFLLLPFSSCYLTRAAVNEPLDPAVIQNMQTGMTAAQVVEKMGAPVEVVQLGRRSAYRYVYTIDKGTGSYWVILGLYNEDTRMDNAWFFFDEKQVMTHYAATFASHRAGFHALPWSDIHDDEDAQADDAARGLK